MRWPQICLFLALALTATGCTRREPRADLVIVNGKEPETLDPGLMTGQADERVGLALFEGLTRYHPVTAEPIPGIAERWDVSPDARLYTFHLRSNAVWSTGEPITAHDFVYSWFRVLEPLTAAEYAGQLYFVKNGEAYNTGKLTDRAQVGIRAITPRILEVELENPTPFFIDLCSFMTLCVVPRQAIEAHGDRWLLMKPLPVSGAYQLEAWRINDKIRLRKNPKYWDAAATRSELIDILPCSSAPTALNLYETGAADIVWDKDLIPVNLIDVLSQRADFHSFDYLGTYFFRFNVTRRPFDDVRVRKAFALATDKKRIVEKITRGGERIASSYVPPGTANYSPPAGLGYDPDTARRLLAEAGFPGGQGFPRFHYLLDTKFHEQIGIELQAMWREVLGVQVELRQLEWKTYLRAQNTLDYDLSRSSWIGDYNDANTFLDMFMSNNGNNRTGWKNERYDRLVREANTLTDMKRRAALLRQAETILVEEELPIVPLYIYAGLEYYDTNRVRGIHSNIRAEHPLSAIYRVGERF